jgi:GPH family glycoside/pentoside/hexuronide:cation symporter
MTEIIAASDDTIDRRSREQATPVSAGALSPVQKGIYATGDLSEAVVTVSLAQYLFFYLTAVVGLSGSLAGTALAMTLVIDAVADPLIGYISDNARTRWGRRHPFMILSAVPLVIALGLLFSVPRIESASLLFGYVFIVLLLLRVSYSCFALPYIALGAELARDYHDRSVMALYRHVFNIVGNTMAVMLGFGLFMSGKNGLLDQANYIPFGWTAAAIVLAMALTSALGTLRFRDRMYAIAPPERSAIQRLPGEIKEVFRNHSFLMLLLTIVVFWVAQGTAINLSNYTYTYFWKIVPAQIQIVLVAGTIGLFVGVFACVWLLKRFEKRDVCTWAIVIVCVLLFLPPVAHIAGLLPSGGFALVAALTAFSFIQSVVLTSVFISFNSMMVDATDEHDLLFGVRREGLYFAALSFSGKAALAIGALFAGQALDHIIEFPRALVAHPEQIPHWTIVKIGLIAGPGAAFISAFSAIAMSRYRITKAELLRIQGALRDRNSGD